AGGALRARSGDRGAVVVVLADSDRVARPDVGAEAFDGDADAGTVRSTHVAKIAGGAGLSRAGPTRLSEGRCPDAGQDRSRPRDGRSCPDPLEDHPPRNAIVTLLVHCSSPLSAQPILEGSNADACSPHRIFRTSGGRGIATSSW